VCRDLYGQFHLSYHQLGQASADKTCQELRREFIAGHLELSCGNLTPIPLTVQKIYIPWLDLSCPGNIGLERKRLLRFSMSAEHCSRPASAGSLN